MQSVEEFISSTLNIEIKSTSNSLKKIELKSNREEKPQRHITIVVIVLAGYNCAYLFGQCH